VLAVIQILEMAGGMHSLIPLYRIFLFFRLIDSFIPLILIYIYQALPFTLFVLTAYLNSTPKAYRDIAELEGMPMLSFGVPDPVPPFAAGDPYHRDGGIYRSLERVPAGLAVSQ
jgi:hypothetical protein